MIPTWQRDKIEADRFIPAAAAVIRKVAPLVVSIEVATDYADQHEATDLVLRVDGGDWCFRVRKPDCRWRDLTIRASRPSGAKTEWAKIGEGFGDFYLYAWTTPESWPAGRFAEWIVVDLAKFRSHPIRLLGKPGTNPDGVRWLGWPRADLAAAGLLVS